jgi:malic enzyme
MGHNFENLTVSTNDHRYVLFVVITSNEKHIEFEDTKGVIRNRKLKKDTQHNGQKKKDKKTNNDLQNITHKPNTILIQWSHDTHFCALFC